MFAKRSNQSETLDDFTVQNEDVKKNLAELNQYNKWLGGEKVLISGLNTIYKIKSEDCKNKKLVIGDLGCGGGELLLSIDKWAQAKKLLIDIIGIDANPYIIEYASQKTKFNQHIRYETLNIFSSDFAQMKFDIVCINSVCHHFSDESFIQLLKTLAQQVRLAILINDLHRHWLSYYTVKYVTKIFNFSPLAKQDAPLSVLRAFRRQELIDIIEKAGYSSYQIRWVWPFRWEIIIWPSH